MSLILEKTPTTDTLMRVQSNSTILQDDRFPSSVQGIFMTTKLCRRLVWFRNMLRWFGFMAFYATFNNTSVAVSLNLQQIFEVMKQFILSRFSFIFCVVFKHCKKCIYHEFVLVINLFKNTKTNVRRYKSGHQKG